MFTKNSEALTLRRLLAFSFDYCSVVAINLNSATFKHAVTPPYKPEILPLH